MSRRLPSLRIGSHAAMSRETETVHIFAEDAETMKGVIAARAALVEKQITRFVEQARVGERLSTETANLALDAMIELRKPDADREKAIHRLELAAAMAITALNTLRKD